MLKLDQYTLQSHGSGVRHVMVPVTLLIESAFSQAHSNHKILFGTAQQEQISGGMPDTSDPLHRLP